MSTKIQLKTSLSTEEDVLVSAYAKAAGTSKSNAARQLMIKGLENQQTAEMLTEKFSTNINSLFRKQENFENRMMLLLMENYKNSGALKAIMKTGLVDLSNKEFDEIKKLLDNAEQSGINQSLSRLKAKTGE